MDASATPVLAVLGPGQASVEEMDVAAAVGAAAARAGWTVLTGGGPGVMEAACRGAAEAGGLTVGILPGAGPGGGYPNRWVRIPIFTGMGIARNAINALSGSLCVALGGGPGTLSEVALALKSGAELWWWRPWRLSRPEGGAPPAFRAFSSRGRFLAALEIRLTAT